ncbi:hypothetical protein QE369_004789 [Agrobacterium larrymoorei]|uniref:Uncharacterized protein n=1 Tax=Agrobacterium larrymoorei TaxID=160699 RepID=A0AAJ2EXE5_9HYPH|nr:hypothetical protein [Agrobacterium larrymoorei]MDR6104592.1 hypothetical protein [Agrobacterium larrymoorei]
MDPREPLLESEDALDQAITGLDVEELPAKGEIPQELEHEIEEDELETDDDPYQESDEALPDDEEERVINRNPSREGGAFDEV